MSHNWGFLSVFLRGIGLCFVPVSSDGVSAVISCWHYIWVVSLRIGVIYVFENCTIRLNNYFYDCSLMWMGINLNVFIRFERIFMLFIMFFGAGCTLLPQAWPLRRSTYNRCITFYNCDFVSFCIRFILADRKLCLNIFH